LQAGGSGRGQAGGRPGAGRGQAGAAAVSYRRSLSPGGPEKTEEAAAEAAHYMGKL